MVSRPQARDRARDRRAAPALARALAGWFAEGKLTAKVDVAEGLENFPEALLRLFKGENTGKLVLKIAEE